MNAKGMDHSQHAADQNAGTSLTFWERLEDTFSQYGFMPHGHCYLWKPLLVYMHVISDLLIGLAYLSISITLYGLVKKINLSYNRIVLCFGIFIGACGLTHFMEIWNLWNADYWWSAWVKVITAIASVGTGVYLFKLRHSIVQVAVASKLAEERRLDLEVLTRTLEDRVTERTAKLQKINLDLIVTENILKTITDNASSSLFMMDEQGRPTFRNPAAEQLTGYNLEEIKDRPLHYAIHYRRTDGSPYPMEECPIDNAQAELKQVQTAKNSS